jgi:hypothetical protein
VTTPFLALAPNIPRVVDIAYSAMLLPCVDQNVTDITDQTDSTETDQSGSGGFDVII